MDFVEELPREARVIPGFVNYYCTPSGEVFCKRNGKFWIRAHSENKRGYIRMCLSENGKASSVYLHRLVASAFLGVSKSTVNHKDGNPKNNHIDNLEYVTLRENSSHSSLMKNKTPGIHQVKASKMWYVQVFIGSFKTKEEAIRAHINALNVLKIKNKYIAA